MIGAVGPVSFNGIVPTANLLASLIGVPVGAEENIAHSGAYIYRFVLQEAARLNNAHTLWDRLRHGLADTLWRRKIDSKVF